MHPNFNIMTKGFKNNFIKENEFHYTKNRKREAILLSYPAQIE